jgi:hypothetical protein
MCEHFWLGKDDGNEINIMCTWDVRDFIVMKVCYSHFIFNSSSFPNFESRKIIPCRTTGSESYEIRSRFFCDSNKWSPKPSKKLTHTCYHLLTSLYMHRLECAYTYSMWKMVFVYEWLRMWLFRRLFCDACVWVLFTGSLKINESYSKYWVRVSINSESNCNHSQHVLLH